MPKDKPFICKSSYIDSEQMPNKRFPVFTVYCDLLSTVLLFVFFLPFHPKTVRYFCIPCPLMRNTWHLLASQDSQYPFYFIFYLMATIASYIGRYKPSIFGFVINSLLKGKIQWSKFSHRQIQTIWNAAHKRWMVTCETIIILIDDNLSGWSEN